MAVPISLAHLHKSISPPDQIMKHIILKEMFQQLDKDEFIESMNKEV